MCELALNGMSYNSWSWNKDGEDQEHWNVDNHMRLNKKMYCTFNNGFAKT